MRSASLAFASCLSWSALALGQTADPGLTAGGLAPPPKVEGQGGSSGADGAPTPEGTDQTLAEADREDSGRGLEFVWLNGEVGVQHLGLETISADGLLGAAATKRKFTNAVAGAGLGARLVFLTVGARFRYGYNRAFEHFTVGAEGAVHFPFGSLEPYAGIGLGYARVLELTQTVADAAGSDDGAVDVKSIAGFDGRLFGGVDYYLTNMFSVGVNVSGDVLFLFRPADETPGPTPASSGKSIGAGVTATAVGGLHF